MGAPHGYRYVGPAGLAERARLGPDVITVTSAQVLSRWLASRPVDELGEPFTFVVGLDGQLRLAPRRSEHVDCAAGQPLLAAGEVLFADEGARWSVSEISNQSTGYCPDPDSWPVVASALDRIGLAHPGGFTHEFVFRRCLACGQLNIVRDGSFACAVCDSVLPARWNIGPAGIRWLTSLACVPAVFAQARACVAGVAFRYGRSYAWECRWVSSLDCLSRAVFAVPCILVAP